MKIDVHWHHVPAAFADAVVSGRCRVAGTVDTSGPDPVVTVGNGFKLRLTQRLTDPAAAIAAMDAAGLDAVAPSLAPPIRQYDAGPEIALDACRLINDSFAETAQAFPGRFHPLANVPLQDPDAAAAELRRCMLELGLRGVAIGTNVEGENLGDERFRPFWRAVAELDPFVFLHPETVMGAADRLRRHELENFVGFPVDTAVAAASLIFDGVYQQYGRIKTCFAHGGGAFPYLISRWEHGYWQRIAARRSGVANPYAYLPSLYCDSLTHGGRQLAFLIDVVGADHVMLGGDYPFDMGVADPVRPMERVVTGERERALIAGGNAAALLGIDAAGSV
jgi:aminocarboxymuconate-semialdehyde decarboxylase